MPAPYSPIRSRRSPVRCGPRSMAEARATHRAVFLDRDGTIVEDPGFLHEPAKVRLLPGAAAAIRRLNDAGWLVATVSNQSGIARGLYDAAAYAAVQRRVVELLAAHGARLDGAYFCPHHPEITGPCECRKPGVRLFRGAAAALGPRLPHATRSGPPGRKHVRAGMAAPRPRGRDGDDRSRAPRVRRLRLPARPGGGHGAAAGRRLGRPLQRPAHRAIPRHRGLPRRDDQPRAARDRGVHPDRDRGPKARRAGALHAVTPVPVAVLVSGGGTNLQALLDALGGDSAVARITRVVSSRADSAALERARRADVPVTVLADPAGAAELVLAVG